MFCLENRNFAWHRLGLRVIDPDYINIMITGHQHTIFVDLQEKLISKEAVEKAKAVGAKGFKLDGMYLCGTGFAASWFSLYRSI